MYDDMSLVVIIYSQCPRLLNPIIYEQKEYALNEMNDAIKYMRQFHQRGKVFEKKDNVLKLIFDDSKLRLHEGLGISAERWLNFCIDWVAKNPEKVRTTADKLRYETEKLLKEKQNDA